MTKKGQGLSMTTIVVAALALLVLVVLTLIFTGRLNLWNKGMDETMACNNYCTGIGMKPDTSVPNDGTSTCGTMTRASGVIAKIGNQEYLCCCKS